MQFCTDGGKYLGGAIGCDDLLRTFLQCKVDEWKEELEILVNIAQSQPLAAYAAYTHGVMSKWNYIFRIMDFQETSTADILQPLESKIRTQLLPALTGQNPPNDILRDVFSLPPNLGGLGMINHVSAASQQHHTIKVTAPLVENVQHQSSVPQTDLLQQHTKTELKTRKASFLKQKIEELLPKLPSQLQQCVKLGQEKGAFLWLTPLPGPIDRHGYALHKSDFRDALALRYDLPLQRTPPHSACGHHFSLEHALSCPTGGYTTIRHNEVRDLTASMLREVCHDVQVEHHLQPLTGETMAHRTANTETDVFM